MNYPSIDILFHWLVNTHEILQRACVVVVATYMAIRLEWFRRAIQDATRHWRPRLITALFLGVLGILGTRNGILMEVSGNGAIQDLNVHSTELHGLQAMITFRDMIALSAGLVGGPWVGLGAGLVAGIERYILGGFVGFGSGLATVFLGLSAGLARQFWPKATCPQGTLIVVLLGSIIQKLLVLLVVLLTSPDALGAVGVVVQETIIPETVVNCFGCLLFLSVMKDLERDRLKIQAQQAELRALQAQIEPHFINNMLNAIKALIRRDPEQASEYVVKLARFLDDTRNIAKANSITLSQELGQLESYLDFQQLRFQNGFCFQQHIPESLLDCQVPPRCLLTLAENALNHGRSGHSRRLDIHIKAINDNETLALHIIDNGCGMSALRVEALGKQPVSSERGGGNGLYQLSESLKLIFDGSAKMGIKSKLNKGTEVTLIMPKRSKPW